MDPIALGYPGWAPSNATWDWWPVVGVVLTLWIVIGVLHLRLSGGVLLLAVAIGPLFASVVHAIGTVLPCGIVASIWIVLSLKGNLRSR